MPVSIALLGAGLFAREEYVPALNRNDKTSIVAIYSRSESSAAKLAVQVDGSVDTYYDSPAESGKGLDDLLKRSDIEAVIAALPISVQPEAVKKALAAEKHVLSEKPIAKDVEAAQDLIRFHEEIAPKSIWLVAENFRFLDALTYARDQISEIGGDVVGFHVNVFTYVDENDKFYRTPWRQKPEYQGGFLLDGGVHFIAGLRYLLSGLGQDVVSLAAFTALTKPDLAPADTVHAILATERGRNGTFSVSFGSQFRSGFEISLVTTKGRVVMAPTGVATTQLDKDGEKKEANKEFPMSSGVGNEVDAFVASIESGSVEARASPREGLKDVRIIQSMLESAQEGGVHKAV